MSDFKKNWETYLHYYAPKKLFPNSTPKSKTPRFIHSLLEIADEFDALLLDGFGVLNIGLEPITEMPTIINTLVQQGKPAFVLTNAASFPSMQNAKRYPNWGYSIPPENVTSSRDALEDQIANHPISKANKTWGVISSPDYNMHTIPANNTYLSEDNIDLVDGFLFLGTLNWDDEKQKKLIASLKNNPRPVLIANPDVCAPLETHFTKEPGLYAAEISDHTDATLEFFGKPFQRCYEISAEKIAKGIGFKPASRILMVGDTLHTDILGGNTFGMKTALMADYGFLREKDPMQYITESGITPDFIITKTIPNGF